MRRLNHWLWQSVLQSIFIFILLIIITTGCAVIISTAARQERLEKHLDTQYFNDFSGVFIEKSLFICDSFNYVLKGGNATVQQLAEISDACRDVAAYCRSMNTVRFAFYEENTVLPDSYLQLLDNICQEAKKAAEFKTDVKNIRTTYLGVTVELPDTMVRQFKDSDTSGRLEQIRRNILQFMDREHEYLSNMNGRNSRRFIEKGKWEELFSALL